MIRSVLILGLTFCFIVIAGLWFVWQDKEIKLNSPMNLDREAVLNVEPGTSLSDLALQLTKRGWLEHPNYLIFEARRRHMANRIKSGEFLVTAGTTPMQLLEQLVEGKTIQHHLTLVEGWSFNDIRNAVESETTLRQTITDWSPEGIVRLLDLPYPSPEGLFFPDTYHFPRGTSDVDFLERAWQRLELVLEEEWQQRGE
ncbi:MAG: endolytic transglycosylase MltG, partial [Gammaproteobacteria bacterium]|nr:endolytic transglycosylase MltG [Gammaproteobacteria bacterium]